MIRALGWLLIAVASVIILMARNAHLAGYPELGEVEALMRWWRDWSAASLLILLGLVLIRFNSGRD